MCIDFGILPKSDNIYDYENNNTSLYLYHHIYTIVFISSCSIFYFAFFSYSLHFHIRLLLDVFSRYLIIQCILHCPFHHCIFIVPTHLLHFHIHPWHHITFLHDLHLNFQIMFHNIVMLINFFAQILRQRLRD